MIVQAPTVPCGHVQGQGTLLYNHSSGTQGPVTTITTKQDRRDEDLDAKALSNSKQ